MRRPDDLEGLDELFEACRVADGHAPLGEHKYLDLTTGRGVGSVGIVVEDRGRVVAYVHLSSNRDGWGLEVAVHPLRREPDLVLAAIDAALEAVRNAGGGRVTCWAYHPAIGDAVASLGFEQNRELLQLRRALPPDVRPAFPSGVVVDSFRVGVDEAAWLDLTGRAFVDHAENGFWTPDTLRDRLGQEWFDPDGFLMAREGATLAGFCWTKLHPDRLGEIYVIAVDPDYRQRSLGKALTLAGLWYLNRERGATTGMLYVDAANPRALALYRGLGFHLDHIDRAFVLAG